MPTFPLAEWKPDLSDLNAQFSASIDGVIPRGDGYGPAPSLSYFSNALGDTCRGFFQANNTDGSVTTFAATATGLYLLDNTYLTWSNVSKGGAAYSGPTSSSQWQFAQFNSFVFAVNANDPVQVWTLGSSSAFADLGGSPPNAGGIAIVGRFVVLFDLASNPYRIHWSGLNATTTWTSGVNYSDYQDLPDGGRVRGVAGGEFGVIMQQRALRRMTYVPGAAITFQIERMSADVGLYAPYSVCQGDGRTFLVATNGIKMMGQDGALQSIGAERVDRTFLADLDTASLQYCIGAVDPSNHLFVLAYKSLQGASGLFDKALCYNWVVDKWGRFAVSGEYLGSAALPGLTLEGLDAIAPGSATISGTANSGGLVRLTVSSTSGWTTGDVKTVSGVTGTTEANGTWTITVIDSTHVNLQGTTYANAYISGGVVGGSVDELGVSLDEISSVATPSLAAFNSSHKLSFFTGDNVEATLETPETLGARTRININGAQPITDAATCYVSIGGREKLNGALTYGDESALDSDGYCPLLENVRSGRAKLRIPAGENWTYATAIDLETTTAGRY